MMPKGSRPTPVRAPEYPLKSRPNLERTPRLEGGADPTWFGPNRLSRRNTPSFAGRLVPQSDTRPPTPRGHSPVRPPARLLAARLPRLNLLPSGHDSTVFAPGDEGDLDRRKQA
jgi:hypothetical protein